MQCGQEIPEQVTSARYYHRRTQTTSVGTRCQKSLNLKESYGNGGDSFLAHPFPTSFTFHCVFNDAAPIHPQPPLPPTPNPLPLRLWALRCASRPPLDERPYLMYLSCHATPGSPLLSFLQLLHLFGICLKNRPCSFPSLCKQNDISFIEIRDERSAL